MEPIQPSDMGAVVFDFDGTLAHLTIDFGRMTRDVIAAIHAHGLDDPELERLYVLEMVAEAQLRVDEPERLVDECARAIEKVEVAAAADAKLIEGVPEALEALRRAGLRVGVITRNCRKAVFTVDDGLLDRIDALVARDDADRVKPDPAHVHQCLAEMDAAGLPTAVVGDHPMDMTTALGAEALAIGVPTGNNTEADLWRAGAHHVAASAPAAVAWLLEARRHG
jgi:phosphoglycolate phosphatase